MIKTIVCPVDFSVFAEVLGTKLLSPGEVVKTPTGFPLLDEAIGGISGIMIIAGPAGHGKSTLVQNAGLHVLATCPDTALIVYQLDMTKAQCFDRFACALAGCTERELRDPNLSEDRQNVVNTGLARLKELSRRIDLIQHPHGVQLDVPQMIKRRNAKLVSPCSGPTR